MMGTENPAEFGLIPRICFGLFECIIYLLFYQFIFYLFIHYYFLDFESIEQNNENECSIEFSFLEIYNETLRLVY